MTKFLKNKLTLLAFFVVFIGCGFSLAGKASATANVYYSVGQNTSDHSIGAGGATCSTTGACTMTIAGGAGQATFNYAQTATNLGVGDQVTFNTSSICYIASKTSTSVWNLVTALGAPCSNVSNATVNSIAHAFSSLNNVFNGTPKASDTNHIATTSLVSADVVLNVPVYYDTGPDTTGVNAQSLTTDATHYIRIYTPTSTTAEVNQSQRAAGKWDTTKWYLSPTDNYAINVGSIDFIKLDGLQLTNVSPTVVNRNILNFLDNGAFNEADLSNSIIKASGDPTYNQNGINISAANAKVNIWNTILFNFVPNLSNETGILTSSSNSVNIYSSTVINARVGIRQTGGTVVCKNTYAGGGALSDYFGTITKTTCASRDASGTAGLTGIATSTATFINVTPGSEDYHITSGSALKGVGTNTSGDSSPLNFTTDIDGQSRGSTWDIGADQYFVPDLTAPNVAWTSPANNALISGSTTLTASSTDNVAVGSVAFYYGSYGGTFASSTLINSTTTPSGNLYSILWNTTAVANGSTTLWALSTDTSSNTSTASTTVNIENPIIISGVSTTTASSTATFSWTTNHSANSLINYGTSSGYGSSSSTPALVTSHSITLTGLTNNTTYHYQISSTDAQSNVATTTDGTFYIDTQPPSVPASLTASTTSASQINITWNASTDNVGVTGYDIYRNNLHIATTSLTSYSDTGLNASTTYSYYVDAFDAIGNTSASSTTATATTQARIYYIDFQNGSDSNNGTSTSTPWQRAPGMQGFSGTYTHNPGDQFIFRGGITWDNTIAPWNITNSGASGTPDYYGINKSWYSGGSWTRPIFDGGSQNTVSPSQMNGYFLITGSYITMDNLQLQNIGVVGINQGNEAVVIQGSSSNITVKNMVLSVYARIAIYYRPGDGTSKTLQNITFSGNDISNCTWGIAISTPYANTVINGVSIHDNLIHDFHNQMASAGYHTDGIFTFSSVSNDPSSYTTNEFIYNNYFYGNWSNYVQFPTTTPALISVSGAAPVAGTYYVETTCVGVSESNFSPEASITTSAPNQAIQVSSPPECSPVSGWNVYFSTAGESSTLYKQNSTPITTGTSWTQSSSISTSGANPPAETGVTAFMYFSGTAGPVYIYNNHGWDSASNGGTVIEMNYMNIYTVPGGQAYIYNNSFNMDTSSPQAAWQGLITAGLAGGPVPSLTVRNNIFAGSQAAIYSEDATTTAGWSSDYDDFYGWTNISNPVRLTGLTGCWGNWPLYLSATCNSQESHGANADPKFISSTNLQLSSSASPAYQTGTNLTSVLTSAGLPTTDAAGNSRPTTGPWDMGAYQYVALTTYTIGGTISGLSGTVVLQDNGGDNYSTSTNGTFTFATALNNSASYSVTVLTQPSGQTCNVTNGSGTVSSANVSNVSVSCSNNPTYTIGGSISGLTGTVVLQNNGGDNISTTTNTSFIFATATSTGGTYSVTVLTQPSGQTCNITNGTGTVASSNITNVSVSCTTNVVSSGGGGGATYASFSNVTVASTTATSTIVTWQTNYQIGSAIDYGLTNSYGSIVSSSTSVTNHSLALTSLNPATTYHFRVKDPNLQFNASGDYIFTTLAAAGTVVTLPPASTSTPTSTPPQTLPFPPIGITLPTTNNPSTVTIVLPYNVHDGQLLQFKGNPTIYLVKPSGLYPFDTFSSFQTYQGQSGEKLTVLKGTKAPYTIQSQIAGQILGQTSSSATSATNQATGLVPPSMTFARNLGYLSKGADVTALQQFLNQNNFPVAPNGVIGSPGHETTLFGLATKAALKKFQSQYKTQIGISAATGALDTLTRNFINSLK